LFDGFGLVADQRDPGGFFIGRNFLESPRVTFRGLDRLEAHRILNVGLHYLRVGLTGKNITLLMSLRLEATNPNLSSKQISKSMKQIE
jgi:hypothetical protein